MSKTEGNFLSKQYEFAAHLRDPDRFPAPDDVEDRRMQIYRDLFFDNIVNFLADSLPVLAAQLGEERWKTLVRDFYRDHESHSPLFPQLAREFLLYLGDERAASPDSSNDPAFLYELAHYEWLKTDLKLAADPQPVADIDPNGDLLEERPQLSGLAVLASYTWSVSDFDRKSAPEAPEEQPAHYLVYRNNAGQVIYNKLNILSARLFQLLDDDSGLTGRQAIEQVADELQHPDPGKVMAGGLDILSRWRESGIVIGTL